MSYLGNKSTGFTPDIPEHTLRPVKLNCLEPRIKYLHHFASAYTTASNLELHYHNCPVSLLLELLKVKDFGLPVVSSSLAVSKLCKKSLVMLHRMGFMSLPDNLSAASSNNNSDEAGKLEAVQLRHQLATNGNTANSRSSDVRQMKVDESNGTSASNAALWPHLHELVWLRNCQVLQAAGDQPRRRLQTQSPTDATKAAVFPAVDNSRQGARHLAVEDRSNTAVTGSVIAVNCSAVAWHVMRYMLPEYAEDVARDDIQEPVADVDPRLPVLLLNNMWSPVVLGATSLGARESSGSEEGCLRLGVGCPMDVLQRVVLPAAVQWVAQHLDQLPLLKVDKKKED
eukprot:gene9482-9646_t